MGLNKFDGYLVIGDISGYTSYVAQTELEHSQAVLSELLELIVNRLKPLLRLVKLEGDAVFAHAPGQHVPRGESLAELIESTYVAFRGRVDGIVRHTTCECKACTAIPTLDLKFLVHYGDYVIQHVSGIDELVGTDVNLVHRLTKNHVSESTGWQAYALFTGRALEQLGMPTDGLHEETESYEHLGEVKVYCLDLRQRFKELTEEQRRFISADEAHRSYSYEFPVPPPVLWDWLTDPKKRNRYFEGTDWSVVGRSGGRTRVGSQNHCAHGKDAVSVETILDWRPHEYYTVESKTQQNKDSFNDSVSTYALEPSQDGASTRLQINIQPAHPGIRSRLWFMMAGRFFEMTFRKLQGMMLEDMAKRDESIPSSPVPAQVIAANEGS